MSNSNGIEWVTTWNNLCKLMKVRGDGILQLLMTLGKKSVPTVKILSIKDFVAMLRLFLLLLNHFLSPEISSSKRLDLLKQIHSCVQLLKLPLRMGDMRSGLELFSSYVFPRLRMLVSVLDCKSLIHVIMKGMASVPSQQLAESLLNIQSSIILI